MVSYRPIWKAHVNSLLILWQDHQECCSVSWWYDNLGCSALSWGWVCANYILASLWSRKFVFHCFDSQHFMTGCILTKKKRRQKEWLIADWVSCFDGFLTRIYVLQSENPDDFTCHLSYSANSGNISNTREIICGGNC